MNRQTKKPSLRIPIVLSTATFAVVILGQTAFGQAGVQSPDRADVAAQISSSVQRGPRGRRGLRGLRGPAGPGGPKGDQGHAGPADTSELLGKTVIITASKEVGANGYVSDFVVCPDGYEAVGGGAFGDGRAAFRQSFPRLAAGTPPPDGQSGPATGWGAVVSVSRSMRVHWTVVCAKIGA